MPIPLQSDQQLLVTCRPCNLMCKNIARRMSIRYVVLPCHLPNVDGDCVFPLYGHCFTLLKNNISEDKNRYDREKRCPLNRFH
jgi:hypothetical protein